MIFADTDFFIALLKEKDWLKAKAREIYKTHCEEIATSASVIIELLMIAERFSLDPERVVAVVFGISSNVEGITESEAFVAAHYIKNEKVNVFDAFHAAYCGPDAVISSDKVFDKLGIKRINLEG